MCGRYASARSVDDLATVFGVDEVASAPAPDWNVAPTKPVAVVVARDERRLLTTMTWGLVPAWATDRSMGGRLFNARLETVTERPAFRDAFANRRCLLPADGWYEWRRVGSGARQPHYLSSRDGQPLAFAGLWECWYDADGQPWLSTTILTGPAPPDLADLHDRAPVVLPREHWQTWLDPATPAAAVAGAVAPTPQGVVQHWPVGDDVGDVRANGPELTQPVPVSEQPTLF